MLTCYNIWSIVSVIRNTGGVAGTVLERKIENWVLNNTGTNVHFECSEAVKLLASFGMLRHDTDDTVSVINLDAAINALPLAPVSMATRAEEETELDEGYDRVFFETEDQYKKDEKKSRKSGWSWISWGKYMMCKYMSCCNNMYFQFVYDLSYTLVTGLHLAINITIIGLHLTQEEFLAKLACVFLIKCIFGMVNLSVKKWILM